MITGEEIKLELKDKYKCKGCLGCNRLEDENFKGVYRCPNFVPGRGEKDDKNRM